MAERRMYVEVKTTLERASGKRPLPFQKSYQPQSILWLNDLS